MGRIGNKAEDLWKWYKIDGECWVWARKLNSNGYGYFSSPCIDGGRTINAHRAAYILTHGAASVAGKDVDHLCRNKACINPSHLEAVTHRRNCLRGDGPTAVNARKSHCVKGHDLSDSYVSATGSRVCRKCSRARLREYKRRQRALRSSLTKGE